MPRSTICSRISAYPPLSTITTGIGRRLLGGRDQLLDAEHRGAVAEQGDHRSLAVGQLGADRGGQAVAEGGVAGRVEQPVRGRERPVVDRPVVGHLRAVARDHGVVRAAPRAAPAGSRAHGPASASASAAIADRAAGSTGPGGEALLAQHGEHVAEHDCGVADDGDVGGDVLVHLRRVEVHADDGATAGLARAGPPRPTGRSRRARSRPRAAGRRRPSPGARRAAGCRRPGPRDATRRGCPCRSPW